MAEVNKWRTSLNESSFSKKIRENNARESQKNCQLESKGLIAVNDNDLFIWDNASCHLINYNLQNLNEFSERKSRFQVLLCTDSPRFTVDWLVWNITKTHLALWGQLGVTVIELPQKCGKFAEFLGGKDNVACKNVTIGEYYFSTHQNVRLLQVSWHPGSTTDTHVVLLTSDNLVSIYDIMDPDRSVQTVFLGDSEVSYSLSLSHPSPISGALGDCVMSFDFGPSEVVEKKSGSYRASKMDTRTVWPVYCVRGNGDVIIAYTDLSHSPLKLPVQGPLLMKPPAEDNYGTDACSILCLQTTPTVVVITTCDGRLHHCVLLPKDLSEMTLQKILRSPDLFYYQTLRIVEACFGGFFHQFLFQEPCAYRCPDEKLMYVNESVELELSLTTPSLQGAQSLDDIFTCPLRLIKDISSPDKYHCVHAAGVHTVVLPWVNNLQRFCLDEEDEDMLPSHQQSIVEHLICTKPLPNSPPSPVLGLSQVKDTTIGTILIALTSDYDFQCLRLGDMRYITADSGLQSTSRGQAIPSPLRKISREPFDERIRKILQKKTSNPLLKSGSNTQMSQQECFQLLSRATQVFREEYIQKQDLARQEIERRVDMYKVQRSQQEDDIQELQESRNILSNNAEQLAVSCEECKEKSEEILTRIENVMRKLQARIPFLSEAERSMKRELENIEDRLETYQRSLKQLEVKREYQERQIKQSRKCNQPSPVIKGKQMSQLKDVLKQEGDELENLMRKLNQLKMDANVR
ncbi:nucleoporin 88-like [Ruditapes philippinarum]|uniref:nucleoporin 88-like n=1 Tax=Ruditapes philippinarum TaxID=129788 RepID=UPI00295AA71B|nr:nucleoporin 88-like [Ruditapes philippinarum]